MKKGKFLSLLLAGVMAAALFAGCGDKDNGSTGDGENTGNTGDTGNTGNTGTPGGVSSVPLNENNKIYVVGDSTVCSFSDVMYLPRYGYGTQLKEYLNVTSSQVVNLALSGRSSLDYLNRSEYSTLTSSISEGDYLVIGFGHNDEKSDDSTRYTNPAKAYDDATTANGPSFQYTLYENYVKMAKDKGATPILCTPIVRYDSTNGYTGAKVHNTANGDYSQAIRTLGTATNTTVIDLTELTKAIYKADNAAALYFHAHSTYDGDKPNETPKGIDETHINQYGAKMVAYQFANALKATDCSLKNHVKDNITAPTKEVDYAAAVADANFTKKDYEPFDPSKASSKWSISQPGWYGTVMGEHGGNNIDSGFKVQESGGTFTVGNANKKGKIEKVDGFAAAFMQISKTKDFKAEANVKLTTITGSDSNPNQAAFGMMLRDDILIDVRDTTLASNYVAAGAFANGSNAIFSRKDTALRTNSRTATISTEAAYTVSIERRGQAVTVKFSDGTHDYTVSDEFLDFNFFAVDSEYLYLCLFATRGITAEFTNVTFTDLGDNTGA